MTSFRGVLLAGFLPLLLAAAPVAQPAPPVAPVAPKAPATKPVVDYTNYKERWFSAPKVENALLKHSAYHSALMDTEVGFNIYLPPGYEEAANAEKRYPVIYWLHGLNQSENTNQFPPKIIDQAMRAKDVPPMIVVFVSGGSRSFYADSPDGKLLAESTLIKELIPHIEKTYRVINKRSGRAIQGMSMGGWGAMRMAMTYPEMFSSVVSFAPSLRTPENLAETYPDVLNRMFGGDAKRFWNIHPLKLAAERADKFKGLSIAFYCGTKDHLLPGSQALHALLTKEGIEHTYDEVESAVHNLDQLIKKTGIRTLLFAAKGFEVEGK